MRDCFVIFAFRHCCELPPTQHSLRVSSELLGSWVIGSKFRVRRWASAGLGSVPASSPEWGERAKNGLEEADEISGLVALGSGGGTCSRGVDQLDAIATTTGGYQVPFSTK